MDFDRLCKDVKISCTKGLVTSKKEHWTTWQLCHADQYKVTLLYQGRTASFDFFVERGRKPEPQTAEVLHLLLRETEAADMGFDGYCMAMGASPLDRKAHVAWKHAKITGRKLRALLGADFDLFFRARP
jgi:hypothetical protein